MLLDIYLREMRTYTYVHNGFTHHSPLLETIQLFPRRRKKTEW